jgi:hypothetical protein
LINRLFALNHFVPAFFLDESLSYARTLQKIASPRFLRRNATDAKKLQKQLATASDGQVTHEAKSLPAIESRRAQRGPIAALQLR